MVLRNIPFFHSLYPHLKPRTLEIEASYLKTEISQSQEWLGQAMITQTAADNHAAETIPMEILETF